MFIRNLIKLSIRFAEFCISIRGPKSKLAALGKQKIFHDFIARKSAPSAQSLYSLLRSAHRHLLASKIHKSPRNTIINCFICEAINRCQDDGASNVVRSRQLIRWELASSRPDAYRHQHFCCLFSSRLAYQKASEKSLSCRLRNTWT